MEIYDVTAADNDWHNERQLQRTTCRTSFKEALWILGPFLFRHSFPACYKNPGPTNSQQATVLASFTQKRKVALPRVCVVINMQLHVHLRCLFCSTEKKVGNKNTLNESPVLTPPNSGLVISHQYFVASCCAHLAIYYSGGVFVATIRFNSRY
jgi:hypothetical protein